MTTILPSSPGPPVPPGRTRTSLCRHVRDFEDAITGHAGAQAIVTRNTHDFSKATLPVFTPAELIKALDVLGSKE